ncbi:unnamed protein product [Parnassius mnemosyne]|uniref:Uncharacterized protein n=1 Tax=Parnassius mnemosyne TaxID=213953 RepID=A0AAV1KEP7_9NEOP
MNSLDPCTEEEIINKLDSNSSLGLDGISTKVIKCVKDLIINLLTKNINKLLQNGSFPDSLKIAKVTPIYKSGPKTPIPYRPISCSVNKFQSLTSFRSILRKGISATDEYLESLPPIILQDGLKKKL